MTLKTMSAHCPVARESGFTLVELLVVMVIALTMLLGVVTLLRQLHHQFRAQTVVSRLNDDARFAFEVIGDAIQGAGSTNPADPQPMDGPPVGKLLDETTGQWSVDSNQLTVRYFSPYGCYGGDRDPADPEVHTVMFSRDHAELERECDGVNEPLIGDNNDDDDPDVSYDYFTTVERLSFSYAIDENADQSVDCWWGGDGIPACSTDPVDPVDPADVIGVRMSLTLSAQNPTPDQPNKQQDQDTVRRTYVMTFAIDSKLGFFVANQ